MENCQDNCSAKYILLIFFSFFKAFDHFISRNKYLQNDVSISSFNSDVTIFAS